MCDLDIDSLCCCCVNVYVSVSARSFSCAHSRSFRFIPFRSLLLLTISKQILLLLFVFVSSISFFVATVLMIWWHFERLANYTLRIHIHTPHFIMLCGKSNYRIYNEMTTHISLKCSHASYAYPLYWNVK